MADTEHKTINVKALIVALEDARKALDAVATDDANAMEHLSHLTEAVETFLEIAGELKDSVELDLVREPARQARYRPEIRRKPRRWRPCPLASARRRGVPACESDQAPDPA